MQKPIALATSVALFFTGCQAKSPTWQKVMATPRATGDAEARDRAYAAELHQQLGSVPHKIVTYEADYTSKFNGHQTGERTAVVYYDEANRKQPWWVMEDTRDKPVWVPNEPLHRQVSFFARRPARILEVHDYTVARDKIVLPAGRSKRPVGTSTLQRVDGPKPVQVVAPVPARTRATERFEEPREKKSRWKFWERRSAKKEPAESRLTPAGEAVPDKRKAERTVVKSETKTRAADAVVAKKAAPAPKPAPKPEPEKRPAPARAEQPKPSATKKTEEKAKVAPAQKTTSPEPAPKRKDEEKPANGTEPKKRPPLINRESGEAAPATPPAPNGDAAAERPQRNLFQRILSSLNPARWFRKAA